MSYNLRFLTALKTLWNKKWKINFRNHTFLKQVIELKEANVKLQNEIDDIVQQ